MLQLSPGLLEVELPVLLGQTGLGQLPYYWHLPILVILISLVYSATRFDEWPLILREALRWGLRLMMFLMVIVAVLYALATFI